MTSDPEYVDPDDVLNSGGRDLSEHDDREPSDDRPDNDEGVPDWWETY